MAAIIMMNAEAWLAMPEFACIKVIDPDGWRREGRSWYDTITKEEFVRRLMESTIQHPPMRKD